MPPKSIFRQPGAKHFQLVHRSQRDPRIHDPDASPHVLKEYERTNAKKGKSRADLESLLLSSQPIHDQDAHVGEAALYGVYYDDTEYNYMQHLRQVGLREEGVDSVMIEAPSTYKAKANAQSKFTKGIELKDLPPDALPSTSELPRTYESQQAVPQSIAGFRPDMDPHLRQVLEALEDDAFVDDDLEDDFFGELVGEGERDIDEDIEFGFNEDGVDDSKEGHGQETVGEEAGWEQRFAQFKKTHKAGNVQTPGSDDEYGSEGGDTIGGLPEMSVIGGKGKKRRKGTSDASGYSMSSSSMFRNEALQTLDERFDQIILKEYNEDDAAPPSSDDDDDDDTDEAPELITARDDFESMMDEFLNDYEILGRKMKLKLEGETGVDKLNTFRRAMGHDERVHLSQDDDDKGDEDIMMPYDVDDKKDRWDCETILTTYTNIENHPRLIRARDPKPVPKIVLNPKTGLPSMQPPSQSGKQIAKTKLRGRVPLDDASEEDSDSDSEWNAHSRTQAIGRPRDESKEDKKARKAAIKVERQTRRADKKTTKDQFGAEFNAQMKTIRNKEKRLKKL